MFLFPTKQERIARWVKNRRTWDKLNQMCFDVDPAIRALAATNVGTTDDNRGFRCLIALLQDDEMKVRVAAVMALGMRGDKNAIDALRGAANDTNNAEFKHLCLKTVDYLVAKNK